MKIFYIYISFANVSVFLTIWNAIIKRNFFLALKLFPRFLVLDFHNVFVKISPKTTFVVKKSSKNNPQPFFFIFTNVFEFQTIWNTKMTWFYAVGLAELRKWVEVAKNSDFTNVFVFSYFRLSSYFSPTGMKILIQFLYGPILSLYC